MSDSLVAVELAEPLPVDDTFHAAGQVASKGCKRRTSASAVYSCVWPCSQYVSWTAVCKCSSFILFSIRLKRLSGPHVTGLPWKPPRRPASSPSPRKATRHRYRGLLHRVSALLAARKGEPYWRQHLADFDRRHARWPQQRAESLAPSQGRATSEVGKERLESRGPRGGPLGLALPPRSASGHVRSRAPRLYGCVRT